MLFPMYIERLDFEKTLLNLKIRYHENRRFRQAVQVGQMLSYINQILAEEEAESPTTPDPEFTVSAPLSPENMPDRIASANSSTPLSLSHPRNRHTRRNQHFPGFPEPEKRRKLLIEFLTIEALTLEEAAENIRKALKVPLVKNRYNRDQLESLIHMDLYQLRKSDCLKITGEGRDRQFKFIPDSTPTWRWGKGTGKKQEI
jgi:hypothetical protein